MWFSAVLRSDELRTAMHYMNEFNRVTSPSADKVDSVQAVSDYFALTSYVLQCNCLSEF